MRDVFRGVHSLFSALFRADVINPLAAPPDSPAYGYGMGAARSSSSIESTYGHHLAGRSEPTPCGTRLNREGEPSRFRSRSHSRSLPYSNYAVRSANCVRRLRDAEDGRASASLALAKRGTASTPWCTGSRRSPRDSHPKAWRYSLRSTPPCGRSSPFSHWGDEE